MKTKIQKIKPRFPLTIKTVSLIVVLVIFATVGAVLLTRSHAATNATTVSNTGVTPVYRFFRYAGGHFFTPNQVERNVVRDTNPGYRYEGVAYYAYNQQVAGSAPVYRLFDLLKGYHFYTINFNEYKAVSALKQYYRDEGVAYYAKSSTGVGMTPVYRLYDYKQGIHFYTISLAEKNYLASNVGHIYRYEGIGYYLPDANGNPGNNSIYLSPTLGNYPTGSTFTVTLRANSVTAYNAVQASLAYDPTKVQYVSMQNLSAMPLVAANSTSSGLIRLSRGTNPGTAVTGDNPVVNLTFKMLAPNGQATLSFDPNYSLIARESDGIDILNLVSNADYWVE